MFTGLIQTTGTVLSLDAERAAPRLTVAAPQLAGRWKVGDSIAVNGVCLTALELQQLDGAYPGRFAADLAQETLQRTTLANLHPGSLVNLELPTPAGSPLGGHVVQGHVDGVGTMLSLTPLQPDLDATDWRMTIDLPPRLAVSVIPQGSITIDGISLTVARVLPPDQHGRVRIEIAVIPHTYRSTNLRSLLSGATVNIEEDVLAKYAARRAGHSAPTAASSSEDPSVHRGKPLAPGAWLTEDYLLANGY